MNTHVPYIYIYNGILLEHLQNPLENSQKEAKTIPLTHKHTVAHFPGLVQTRP